MDFALINKSLKGGLLVSRDLSGIGLKALIPEDFAKLIDKTGAQSIPEGDWESSFENDILKVSIREGSECWSRMKAFSEKELFEKESSNEAPIKTKYRSRL